MYKIKSPVLFLIFNRPETTKRVFEKIRQGKPAVLYVAADGPRPERAGEAYLCQQTRDLIMVDWECEVHTLYRDQNLGCRNAVSGGIDWFFEHVPQGIIIEDDCLPNDGFFQFCDDLLDHYADQEQIFEIAGTNLQGSHRRGPESYYFSRYGGIWGWATWARAWKHYDGEMHDLEQFAASGGLSRIFHDQIQQDYWLNTFRIALQLNTWDYQWVYTIWKNDGICIVPNTNLITNIGFGQQGTHTHQAPEWYSKLTRYKRDIFPVSHPESIRLNAEADHYQFEQSIKPRSSWIKKNIKKLLRL